MDFDTLKKGNLLALSQMTPEQKDEVLAIFLATARVIVAVDAEGNVAIQGA